MRKRISCKVVRSIPLGMCSDELHRSNKKSYKISNATRTPNTTNHVWEPAAYVHIKHIDNSVIYTNRLEITGMPTDSSLIAQKLDFYV